MMTKNFKVFFFRAFLGACLVNIFAGQGIADQVVPQPSAVLSAQAQALDLAMSPLTLRDCYALALKQSETVAIDAQLIKEAEAHFVQSLGTILPQASFVFNQSGDDSAFSPFGRNTSDESKFVFTQTLFSGFKEFAAMAASRFEKQQYVQQKKRAEQMLFVNVADAFYLVLEYQEDLKTLDSIWTALRDRVSELKKREDIGRSRHSEVVNTESQLYSIEANIEQVKSQSLIARELLVFLTGRNIEQVADQEPIPELVHDMAMYEAKVNTRPDVMSKEYAWSLKQKQITIARSDLFPTVTLEGDYYQKRRSDLADADWATIFKVDIPLFQGTTTYGSIQAAKAQARQAELDFQRTQRLALSDIRDCFIRAQSAMMQYKAFEKALGSAELNYALQKQDYQNSLVSNLDVLAAIQTLGNTRRNYFHALYEQKRMYWQLQAAIGDIDQEIHP